MKDVFVAKVLGFCKSSLAVLFSGAPQRFRPTRNIGILTGAGGAMKLMPELVRIPDVAFTRWDRLPGRRCPDDPPQIVAARRELFWAVAGDRIPE